MKKFLSLMFASTLILSAISCGGGKEVTEEGEDDQVETASTSTAAAPAGAPAAAAPVSADAATITGLVKFEGAKPAMPAIQMSADPYCASQHPGGADAQDEEVVVGPGGELANVLVYVENAPTNFPPPSAPAVLEQKGCKYHPHVNAVMVGQKLQIRNDDSTLHNVHAMPEVNSAFNEGQPVQGMVATKTFDKPEMKPFRIKCDVHGWMKSYMAVLPHPFWGVSQMNGQYTIANLPPGSYTLVAWHEKYGEQKQQITVGAKEQKQVAFTFKG